MDHSSEGITPLLFVRQRKKDDRNETVPYVFLGPIELLRWEGERPMNVERQLEQPTPAELLRVATVVR